MKILCAVILAIGLNIIYGMHINFEIEEKDDAMTVKPNNNLEDIEDLLEELTETLEELKRLLVQSESTTDASDISSVLGETVSGSSETKISSETPEIETVIPDRVVKKDDLLIDPSQIKSPKLTNSASELEDPITETLNKEANEEVAESKSEAPEINYTEVGNAITGAYELVTQTETQEIDPLKKRELQIRSLNFDELTNSASELEDPVTESLSTEAQEDDLENPETETETLNTEAQEENIENPETETLNTEAQENDLENPETETLNTEAQEDDLENPETETLNTEAQEDDLENPEIIYLELAKSTTDASIVNVPQAEDTIIKEAAVYGQAEETPKADASEDETTTEQSISIISILKSIF